jgi:GNAT superfamily N-acetyltransferase
MSVVVQPASCCRSAYRSRAYWEEQFAAWGLWPRFLAGGRVEQRCSHLLDEVFLDYQLAAVLVDKPEQVVGIGHSAPIRDTVALPERGWDWAMEEATNTHRTASIPNALCALSVTVIPEFQGKGVGASILLAMIQSATARGLAEVVAPARPTGFRWQTGSPFEAYVKTKRPDGLPVDPWLRTHIRCGGRIDSVCNRSYTVVTSQAQWETWAQESLSSKQEFWPRGALAPVRRIGEDLWEYIEPNVWVRYPLGELSPERSAARWSAVGTSVSA